MPPTKHLYVVRSPVKPPDDWGFKPNLYRNLWIKTVASKQQARELNRDLLRLEIQNTKIAKIKATKPITYI